MQIRSWLSRIGLAGSLGTCLLVVSAVVGAAEDPRLGDIRDVRVGLSAAEQPAHGFVEHRCAIDENIELAGFSDYSRCPVDENGLHAVRFDFDDSVSEWAAVNDRWTGTRVSGHPALLTLKFEPDGLARALDIRTDPSARAYMRKKAFLLRLRVKGRYGADGWRCGDAEDPAALVPIGGMLINERCTKPFAGRELTLTTLLYRRDGEPRDSFTNSTRLEIAWVGE